jgi:hypothetical protein
MRADIAAIAVQGATSFGRRHQRSGVAVRCGGRSRDGVGPRYPDAAHRRVPAAADISNQRRETPTSSLTEATAVAGDVILKRNAQRGLCPQPIPQSEILATMRRLFEIVAQENLPIADGFNIGVNVGESAGQTVFHLHVHVIPRYRGDATDPRGGVRHVLPDKANYVAVIDGAGLARDAEGSYGRTRQPPTARDRLLTGGLDDALLHPLLDDLDAAYQVDIAVAFVFESGVYLIGAHLREVIGTRRHRVLPQPD